MSRANLHDAGSDAVSGDDSLELFPEWQDPITSRRLFRAAIGSLLVHAIVAAVLLTLPETSGRFNGPAITADFRKMAVPLVAPKLTAPKVLEVTQNEPNKGKVTPQLDIRSSMPEAPPKAKAFAPPAPAGPVVPPAATLTPPPQIQAEVATPPISGVAPVLTPPPGKPKIVLENVGVAETSVTPPINPSIKLPRSPLDNVERPGQPGGAGGMVISPDGASEATALRQMQLLSDPLGVDFKPYLLQVLAKVRRNWIAIVPDSARRGQRGLVLIQFSIDRRGGVPKLVIASASGITAFDRAAVAGISASNPFPPLPAAYKGDEIHLQMAFSYNLPAAKP
jgi:TonB family protein